MNGRRPVDHYETLEVSRHASPEVIRAAYKSLMQRLHPDKRPQGQADGERAAQVARAYEVLSDAVQRAAYDQELQRAATAPSPMPDGHPSHGAGGGVGGTRGGLGRTVGGQDQAPGAPAAAFSTLGPWVLALAVLTAGGVGAWMAWGSKPSNPGAELASIHQAFASADLTEAKRRQLFERKQAILSRHPEWFATDHTQKAEDMAGRTFALLDSPLSVRLVSTPSVGRELVFELTIEHVSLLVGTFDAQRHLAHLANHRERLVGALAERLAKVDPGLLAGPQSATYLQTLLLETIVAALGTDPTQTYPSTYFESPGRYGVVGLVLPDPFKLVQIVP
jgi:hypothetical protein